ncbi:MAG: hypothetical protein GC154_15020 [bacterium]|nr:hypothetical protein [bacterium]
MPCILLFEDEGWRSLKPMTWTRPAYDLRCGIRLLWEKAARAFGPSEIYFHARETLAARQKEEKGEACVNTPPPHDFILLNGRVLWTKELAAAILADSRETAFVCQGRLAAARCKAGRGKEIAWDRPIELDALPPMPQEPLAARMVNYPWDLVYANPEEIVSDLSAVKHAGVRSEAVHPTVQFLGEHDVTIGTGAVIDPFVVLDARKGPISIGLGTKILPHCLLQGPCSIGPNCLLKASTHIYEGTSCGEYCKLGGEIENSILQSYSNKQHTGFLGHAYIGQWVNLAADTNNSDLRNDYGVVSCTVDGEKISTGKQFFGAAVGDHVKTGIQAMINTGSMIGPFCNLFGLGYPPREIPGFAWGGEKGWMEYRFDKAIETAQRMMARRNQTMTPALEAIYQQVFEATRDERGAFLTSGTC